MPNLVSPRIVAMLLTSNRILYSYSFQIMSHTLHAYNILVTLDQSTNHQRQTVGQ